MIYDAPNAVWPYYSNVNTSAAKEKENSTLGKDDFLKILIVQLQNQDPLQPMEDKEFIAQMAQFSTVEQIQAMGEEMALLRQSMGVSSDLIGKNVGWSEWGPGGAVEHFHGIVESILFSEGKQYVQVGDAFVPLDEIYQVWSANSDIEEPGEEQADEADDPEQVEAPEEPGDDA